MSELAVSDSVSSPPATSASSPGGVLRRCREFHGLTLEEASETTKIGISHLKALENDQINEFANQAYLKGFLRIYAAYLGLNSDDLTRMYGKLFGVQGEKAASSPQVSEPRHKPQRLISLKKLLFPAFFLTLILITAIFFKRPSEPIRRPPQPAPVATVAVTPPVILAAVQMSSSSAQTGNSKQSISSPKVEERTVKPPETAKKPLLQQPPEVAKGFILKIKVTQNGTLTATVDGSEAQQYDLTLGDIIEWKAEKRVALELSDPGGVEVELNGKPYKQLGVPGKPLYVEFQANGITP